MLQDNCKIGQKGFGFIPLEKKNIKFSHIGRVIINDDVEMNKEVIQIMDDFLMDTVKTDPAEASLMISLLKQRLDASMHLLVNKESMINFIRGR